MIPRWMHRYAATSASASATHLLDVRTLGKRLMIVANSALNILVPLHGERNDGLYREIVSVRIAQGEPPPQKKKKAVKGQFKLTMKQNVNQGCDLITDPE